MFDRAAISQEIIEMNIFKEREAVMKARLDTLVAKLLSLKVECASLHFASEEMESKVSKLAEDLGKAIKAVSQQSVDGMVHMV